jgi:hypothetical protein
MSQAITASALPRSLPALKETALKFMRQTQRFKNMSASNEARAENLIDAVLVVGSAAGMAYANGKQFQTKGTTYQIAGHEADLMGGLLIAGGAVLFPDILGKYSEKAGKIGIGLLASSVTRTAFGKGQAAAVATPAATTAPAQIAPPVATAPVPTAVTSGVAGAGYYRNG